MTPPPPASAASVEFRGVTKRYGAVTAVDTVSFTILPGQLVTLLGPSGCGKTTTLRLIAGLELPSSGQILIGGEDVSRRSAADRDVSMVFQSYALFPHLSVLDNVAYGPSVAGKMRAEAHALARDKLAQVGLAGLEARMPSELSGGQQQRVAVARALVIEPKVLLFDEPLSNLDAKLRRRVRDEIRELQLRLNLTVAYVTHDQSEALAVSDQIIVMSNARIAEMGTPRDLYERPVSRFVADFIGDANLFDVTVSRLDGDFASVDLDGLKLTMPLNGLNVGSAKLAVRPSSIILQPASAGAKAGVVSGQSVPGMVVKAAYLGSHMEYWVAIAGADRFVVDRNVATPLAVGTRVAVALAVAGVALVQS